MSGAIEDETHTMLTRKLIVVDEKYVSNIGGSVIRMFQGHAGTRPIVFKSTDLLQAEPFQLAARVPTSPFRRHIRVKVVARQVDAVFEDRFTGGQDTTNDFGVQVRAKSGGVIKHGGKT